MSSNTTPATTDCAHFNFIYSSLGGIDLYLSLDNCCTWSTKKVQCDSENRITWIVLENLQLDGSISPALGSLSKLKLFSLKNNKLIGKIPENISLLSSLTNLTLSNNPQLEGSIPESLGKLASLTILDLTGTNIGGLLPVSLASNSKLVTNNNGCPYRTQNYCLPSIDGVAPVLEQCKVSKWSTDCPNPVSSITVTSTTASPSIIPVASSTNAVNDILNDGNKPLNSSSTLILVCAVVLLSIVIFGLSIYYGTKWKRRKQESPVNNSSARRKELEEGGHIFPESNVTFISPTIVTSSSTVAAKSSSFGMNTYPQFPAGIYNNYPHHEPPVLQQLTSDPNNDSSNSAVLSLNSAQALDYSGDYVFDPNTNQYYPIKRIDSFQSEGG